MRKLILLAVLTMAAALSSASANAGSVIGPFEDFRGSVGQDGVNSTIVINTRFWIIKDKIIIDIGLRTDMLGLGYVESPTGDFTGDLRVWTFYGVDQNPGGSSLQMTGVNPLSPQFTPNGGENIEGVSGKIYTSDVAMTLPISELSKQFPGFDLSPFSNGIPTSEVYVFGTTVPRSDLPAPEPATVVTACLGVALVIGVRRLRK
jgi:hypothetical protein